MEEFSQASMDKKLVTKHINASTESFFVISSREVKIQSVET